MFQQILNWRTVLALIAIGIVSGTIWYSSYLAEKIAKEERQKVEEWAEASSLLLSPSTTGDTRLHLRIIQDNAEIPIIATDEKDAIISTWGLDSTRLTDTPYIRQSIARFRSQNPPITWPDPVNPQKFLRYYYGHTPLLDEVRYYPLVQLFIVGLFILVTVTALRSSYRSTQNHLWAGMAKETAHQLGTPVSSLEGWVEILKESHAGESFVPEIEKDVTRLRLVSDRFGKIGSTPQLEERNVVEQVTSMVEYIRKRAGGRVAFHLNNSAGPVVPVMLSAPLFDWVIENLLKNALDAMEGKGTITITIQDAGDRLVLDVADTGKGISKQNISRVFNPGFTTKKRGWGLGLSLSKRIIEQYHKGSLTVKNSEPGKGTTFRIVLRK